MATKKAAKSKSNGDAEVVKDTPTSTEDIAAQAWDEVKGDDDADFASCQPNFRSDLIYHAEAVRKSQEFGKSDTVMDRFEREVKKLVDKVGG